MTITHILQFSDIHIRNGDMERSRYQEYEEIFQYTLEQIRNEPSVINGNAIIVICGNLFHHKGKLDTPALKLYASWMQKLLEYGSVYVIGGPHDLRQDDTHHPDILDTLSNMHGFHYLQETGCYEHENIGFGVVSIKDTTYPEVFPHRFSKRVKHPVALFHDPQYDRSWIDAPYQIIMTGGSKPNIEHQNGKTIGTSGSLVQKDYSEPLFGHGYFVWELETRTVELRSIPNRYGFLTMKWIDNTYHVSVGCGAQNQWEPLETITMNPHFPTWPRVRILGDQHEEAMVSEILRHHGVYPTNLYATRMIVNEGVDDAMTNPSRVILSELNQPERWLDFLETEKEQIREWIMRPESFLVTLTDEEKEVLPEAILKKIQDRNARIQKAITEYKLENGEMTSHRIRFLHMGWDYLFCYGPNNYFDFEEMRGSIALLNGRNAMGKSSFLDIISIALYGEPTKYRNVLSGRKNAKIGNDQRPEGAVPRVMLFFEMDDEKYEILRVDGQAQICKVSVQKEREVFIDGVRAVDAFIVQHFGPLDDTMMSSILCQTDMTNFFYLPMEEQKRMMDAALHLQSVSAYGNIVKEATLAYKEWENLFTAAISTVESNAILYGHKKKDELENLRKRVCELESQIHDLESIERDAWIQLGKPKDPKNLLRNIDTSPKYYTALLQRRKKYDDISDEEMENAGSIEERLREWERVKEELAKAEEAIAKVTGDARSVKEVQKELEKHEKTMPMEPHVTMQHLQKMMKDMDSWKKSHANHTTWLNAPDDLYMQIEQWKEERLTMGEVIKPSGKEPEKIIRKWKMNWENPMVEKEYQELSLRREEIQKRWKTLPAKEDHAKWLVEKKEWERLETEIEEMNITDTQELRDHIKEYDAYIQSRKKKERELQDWEEEFERYEKEWQALIKAEYNAECWACQKQPKFLRRQELEELREELTKKIKKRRVYIAKCVADAGTMEEVNMELEQMLKNLARREHYDRYKKHMEKQRDMWAETEQHWEQMEEWESFETMWQTWDRERKQWQWHRWNEWNELNQRIEDAERFLLEYNTREKDMILIQEETVRHAKYREWQERYKMLQKEKEIAELRERLDALHIDGDHWKRVEEKKQCVWEIAILQWHQYTTELREKRDRLQAIQNEIAISMSAAEAHERSLARSAVLQRLCDRIKEVREDVQELEERFLGNEGYKEWIYREHVAPLLEKEVNLFLSTMESIRLQVSYQKKGFVYHLMDRGNLPTLDKASGYQNFVVAFAMRLALVRMGATGQNLKHLFIDEGFTSFDMVNIEKVPHLLQCVMSYGDYDSILLMSHLEQVQESAQIRVDIRQENGGSQIQYGVPYPVRTSAAPANGTTPKKARAPRKKNTLDLRE